MQKISSTSLFIREGGKEESGNYRSPPSKKIEIKLEERQERFSQNSKVAQKR